MVARRAVLVVSYVFIGLAALMASQAVFRVAGAGASSPQVCRQRGWLPPPALSPIQGEGGREGRAGSHLPYIPPGLRPPSWTSRQSRRFTALLPAVTAAPSAAPDLPDIQVAYLSREPLYPSYVVEYPDGQTPTLRPGTENDKHWPDVGEPITFTAHLANRGSQPAGLFAYRWRVDGRDVLTGTISGLMPGQWITLTMYWQWDQARHWVAFAADIGNAITEVSEQNNDLEEATNALYQDIRVHPYIYAAFTHYLNNRGSYTFEDWLQAQYATMNQRFAQAIYPEAPQGILDRVRINSIRVSTDVYDALPNYDGGWQFAVPPDDPDTPENESMQWAEQYAAAFAGGVDWGLIHELTHQLGFIDLYTVHVDPDRVLLPDKDGLPLLASYTCRNCDLMGGGDTAPYRDATYYSGYAAAALNRNYGYRRGYYGDFLFDIPLTNVLSVRDNAGAPLAGAQVQVYQTSWNSLPETPVISGMTDANGVFMLPNRPLSVSVTTATGHTLHPNPFGQIDVVGENGQFLIKVSRNGHEDYLWKQILDFNLAYWAGMTQTYTITWQTHLPPPTALPALPATTGRTEQGIVSLSWSAQAGAVGYRLYASADPFDEWQLLGRTVNTSFSVTPTWHTRYAVTAIDAAGRESGFGPIYRAFYWVYPSDVTYEQEMGNWLVLDAHSGAIVSMTPNGRVIGNRTARWDLVGAQAFSHAPDGSLAVAKEASLTVFNNALRRTGYVGRSDWESPPIDQASGVLLTGEVLTTATRFANDAATLFLAHFDGDLNAGGSLPLTGTATFTSGVSGQAVEMGPGMRLAYTSTGHIVQEQGGLDMWVRPDWPDADRQAHVFFSAGDGRNYLFEVGSVEGYIYAYLDSFDGYHTATLWSEKTAWQPGTWHHIGVAWMPHWFKLYVDGELADVAALRRAIIGTPGLLTIGTDVNGEYPAMAAIDEVRISGLARLGNSDRVRLLVSEEMNGRIKVLDLMGNLLATWSEVHVQRPRGLADLGNGLVAVADTGDGTIKLLSYDGDRALAYRSTFVGGLSNPQNISSDGVQVIVPDYGHGSVKVFDLNGSLQALYSGPNDGYEGAFGAPAAAAKGSGGDLIVADKARRRVVFVHHGEMNAHLYFPVILR